MKKRYEIKGMMEWHPEFKVGRSCLRLSFTGGHLCGGACTPASYETSDPVVQKVIEDSAAFRSGRIRLASQPPTASPYGRAVSQPPTSRPTCNPSNNPTILEYSNKEDIFDYLEQKCGIPVEQLTTPDSCFEEAQRLGITLKQKSQ